MPKLNLYSPILELKSKLVSVSKTPLIDLNAEIALSNPSKLLDVISAAKSHLPFVVYRPVISGSCIMLFMAFSSLFATALMSIQPFTLWLKESEFNFAV